MIPLVCNSKHFALPLSMTDISVTEVTPWAPKKQHGLRLVWTTLAFTGWHAESEPEHQTDLERCGEAQFSRWELTSDTGFSGGQATEQGKQLIYPSLEREDKWNQWS